MAWIPGAIAAVGGIYGGIMGANAANDAADRASDLQNREFALRKGLLDERREKYGPLEDQLLKEATSKQPLDYGLMSGNVNRNFDAQGRATDEAMASRGLTGSGLQAGSITAQGMARASALADVFQRGLSARRAFGAGLLGRYNPEADVAGAAGALGNQADMALQQQGLAMNASGLGFGAAASGLSDLTRYYSTHPVSNTGTAGMGVNLTPNFQYGLTNLNDPSSMSMGMGQPSMGLQPNFRGELPSLYTSPSLAPLGLGGGSSVTSPD